MARLKENDAVLVANRRDRPSDRLECERRVPLRGRVAPVVSLRGGSRLASRRVERRREREVFVRAQDAGRVGLHVGWRHLRIGPGFAPRGFARRGGALLGESARQGFLTNATIECTVLACARAVITLWLRSCCCCRWLISIAQG